MCLPFPCSCHLKVHTALCSQRHWPSCCIHCGAHTRWLQCTAAPSPQPRLQNTFFCMDCPDTAGLCSVCVRDHAGCHTLQIRRYVYRDVVKTADLAPHYDTSGVQSYTVNHSQAVFLSAKDKAPVGPYYRVDSTARCQACRRGLRAGCHFCSLACKVRGATMCPHDACAGCDHAALAPAARMQDAQCADAPAVLLCTMLCSA